MDILGSMFASLFHVSGGPPVVATGELSSALIMIFFHVWMYWSVQMLSLKLNL